MRYSSFLLTIFFFVQGALGDEKALNHMKELAVPTDIYLHLDRGGGKDGPECDLMVVRGQEYCRVDDLQEYFLEEHTPSKRIDECDGVRNALRQFTLRATITAPSSEIRFYLDNEAFLFLLRQLPENAMGKFECSGFFAPRNRD